MSNLPEWAMTKAIEIQKPAGAISPWLTEAIAAALVEERERAAKTMTEIFDDVRISDVASIVLEAETAIRNRS